MPLEETASAEGALVVLTVGGFLKRVGLEEFETQKRGGKGIVGGKPKEEDAISCITPARSLDKVLFFTNLGRCYSIDAAQIPVMSRYAIGKKATALLGLAPEEHVTFMLAHGGSFEEQPLVLLSSKGMIKRTALSNFRKPRAGGTVAMSLAQGDSICAGYVSARSGETMIITSAGKVVRFDEDAVRIMGKAAQGVRGVRLSPADIAVTACPASEGLSLLVVSEKGFGKLTAQEQFRKTARGAGGVTGAKLNDKTGKVAFAGTLRTAEIILCSKKGKFIRFASVDVRETGRAAVGVRLMKLEAEDVVSTGTIVVRG
jgi:DNA gyrase subunit A